MSLKTKNDSALIQVALSSRTTKTPTTCFLLNQPFAEALYHWVNPEGTRNWTKPLPFKLGAFKLAIEAGVPIQPVCFSLRDKTMDYSKFHSGTVKARCLEPISTEGLTQDDALDLAIRCRKLMEAECIAVSKTLPMYKEEGYPPLNQKY